MSEDDVYGPSATIDDLIGPARADLLPFSSLGGSLAAAPEDIAFRVLPRSQFPTDQFPQYIPPSRLSPESPWKEAVAQSLANFQPTYTRGGVQHEGVTSPGGAFAAGLMHGIAAGLQKHVDERANLQKSLNDQAAFINKLTLERYQQSQKDASDIAKERRAQAAELAKEQREPKLRGDITAAETAAKGPGSTEDFRAFLSVYPKRPGESDASHMLRARADWMSAGREPEAAMRPEDYAYDVQKDVEGNAYLDLSKYTGNARKGAMDAARKLGVMALGGPQANAIGKIDEAVLNIPVVRDAFKSFAPKDWMGRPLGATKVKVSQWSQIDPQAAAYSALQLAAIQFVQAVVAGQGSGFRMNTAEIKRSVENDMPRPTDTIATGQQKLDNLDKLFRNIRRSIMVKDRSVLPGGANATVKMEAPDGTVKEVPASKVEGYKARGAKVVP